MRAQFATLMAVGVFAASPVAAANHSEAVLAKPASRAVIVLDDRVWHCDGRVCRADRRGRSQSLTRECARVARRLGALIAYSRAGAAIDPATLALCNAGRRS